jgi:hypothetical protein
MKDKINITYLIVILEFAVAIGHRARGSNRKDHHMKLLTKLLPD